MAYRQYREIKKGEFFVVFGDTATGLGDYTAIQFLSKTNIDIPLVFHDPMTTSEAVPTIHRTLEKIFDITRVKPVFALERNNGGVFLMDRFAGLNINYKYELFRMPRPGDMENTEKLGWDTNTATRPKMLVDFKNAVDANSLQIYDRPTITEMFSFIRVQSNTSTKAQAEKGMHDDLVMSGAGAWQLYQMCDAPQTDSEAMSDMPVDELFDEKTGLYI